MTEKIYMRPEKIPTSNRGLEKYLSDLNLTKETLEDKRILDLGSGTRRFAKELEDGGVKAEIFSLDPIFENPKEKIEAGAEELSEQLSKTRRVQNTVAGLGEHLPFKNNSFDLILAEYSLRGVNNLVVNQTLLIAIFLNYFLLFFIEKVKLLYKYIF